MQSLSKMPTSEPACTQLTLELFRAVQADDPFAFRVGVQEYVRRSALGGAETATLDWNQEFLSELAAIRLPGRNPALLQRVGDSLQKFLGATNFAREEAELLAAVQRGESVTITLRLSAAELYALPWELLTLKATGQPLGSLPGVLLRYAWPDTATTPEQPAPRPEGGRVLLAWSAAGGVVPASEHQHVLSKACLQASYPFDPVQDVLPHVSYGRLAEALTRATTGEPIAVLHLLCHGVTIGNTFGLSWDGPDGQSQVVDAAQLRQLLAPHAGRLRLVILAACDSGNSGALGNRLGSLAQTLHRAGIAAVIGSRYPLSMAGAVTLAAALYGSLIGGPMSVEAAFVSARQRLAHDTDSLDWASLQLYARPEDGDDTRPLVLRPYRALEPFFARHSRFFFGRERERQKIREALTALHRSGRPRFLIVAGASGTGKSSVVLGGLLPDLTREGETAGKRRDTGTAQKLVAELRRVLASDVQQPTLGTALATLSAEVDALEASHEGPWEWAVMRPGTEPLAALQAALRSRREPGRPFLLVVDQFEELFTHTSDSAVRNQLAARLWALASEADGIHCVLTLRVDFLGHCGELTLTASGLRLDQVAYAEEHRIFIAQLAPAQLAEVIVGPARLVGLTLAPGLMAQMLAEVTGEPGALPLLEYVLDRLWRQREGNVLSAASYAELGGVSGALSKNADALWAGLDATDQRLAQKLLVRLVGFSDSSDGQSRRRVPLGELREQIADPTRRLDSVLTAFVEARLLVRGEEAGQAVVEVAHEALIRQWERLQRWLRNDRQRLEELRELGQWAEQYRTYGTRLRGAQLGYAQRLLQKYPDELGRLITQMIRDSLATQRRQRLRLTAVITFAMSLLAALSLAVWFSRQAAVRDKHLAVEQSQRAQLQARLARSRLLGKLAERELDPQPATALLLATQAVRLQDEFQSQSILRAALEHTRPLRAFLPAPSGRLHSVAFRADGKQLVAVGGEPVVWLYDVSSATVVEKKLSSRTATLHAVAFSASGRRISASGNTGEVWLWDTTQPTQPAERIPADARALYSLDFSPDEKLLAAGTEDGRVLLFDLERHAWLPPLFAHTQLVTAVNFRPGAGTLLASSSADGTVRVFDVTTGTPTRAALTPNKGALSSVVWSPDGKWLAAGSEDRAVLLWDAQTGKLKGEPLRQSAAISGIGFNPDGRLLAACSLDHTIAIWDVESGRQSGRKLTTQNTPVHSCAWSPDGSTLASGGDGELLLWDLNDHPASHRRNFPTPVSALAIDPQNRRVVIGSPDGSLRPWPLAAAQPGLSRRAQLGAVNAVAFSADGSRLAAGGTDGEVRLRDPATLDEAPPLPGAPKSALLTLAFAARGDSLAAGYADGTLVLWDLKHEPSRRVQLAAGQQAVNTIAFSPDGSLLVTGGFDGSIAWRNPQSGLALCSPKFAHKDSVTSLGFNQQGTLLASGSIDHAIALWSRTSSQPECPAAPPTLLHGHRAGVTAVGFATGIPGETLVAGDEDGLLILWDVKARKPLGAPLYGHLKPITALIAGPDGLLITGDDETIWRWNLKSSAAPTSACTRANRNLTIDEWKQYLDDTPYCRICDKLPADPSSPTSAPLCEK